jgi:demethylmenaquinone methyltransferase / 2-methoxy-6-polyprenyl-1,4-benzoquinol methylase
MADQSPTGQRGEPLAPHPPLERYYDGEGGRRGFVRGIFDATAADYDRVERMMALRTGGWYRRRALERAGVAPGMRVLDVATGTGLVAREVIALTGAEANVVGLDPSVGMVLQARKRLTNPTLLGFGESLPCSDCSFDFLSMGYALRHLSDLTVTFREFYRVLRPGGRLCLLEITPPAGKIRRGLLRAYVRGFIPLLTRLTTRHGDTALLWEYFWDTMDSCVAPASVLAALEAAGFTSVNRYVELGIFSEYRAVRL